jgi:hypothetical protein
MATSDAPMGIFETSAPGEVNESFVITAGGAGGFKRVSLALAKKLAHLNAQPGQHNAVLDADAPGAPYVQCIVDDIDGVWLEAISNEFLGSDGRLTASQEHLLTEGFGFAPPDEDLGPNFSQHLQKPVDWAHLGMLMVTVLRDVYGAREHDALTLTIYPHHRVPD